MVWAAIYLPALGSLEIKGEEGRRILPAVGMLESGNYMVPRVGSDPYLRKPPLINWLVAASFKIFGHAMNGRRDCRPRCAFSASRWCSPSSPGRSSAQAGSFIAAIVWLTNFGMHRERPPDRD